MPKELELTDDMIARNDDIDNSVHELINTLAEREVEWNMEIINDVTDAVETALKKHGIRVCRPHIVTKEGGEQEYAEYED